MRSTSSSTATTVALQRAFESHRPPATRLFADPLADDLITGGWRVLAAANRVPPLRPFVTRLYDAVAGPGPRPSAVARTRYIDDAVTAAVRTDEQVVLLGAGFDSRAHRLESLRGVPVYEVDHPATQARKQELITRCRRRSTTVDYVPVDFEHDDLETALITAGLDRGRRTCFVWEGVTNYLTATAVDHTLATIRRLAPHGGTLVMTYVHAGVLDGSVHFPGSERWMRNVARLGEPWTFGIRPEDASVFFATRGFVPASDVSTADVGDVWFGELGRREHPSALYRIAVAQIDGTEGEVAECPV